MATKQITLELDERIVADLEAMVLKDEFAEHRMVPDAGAQGGVRRERVQRYKSATDVIAQVCVQEGLRRLIAHLPTVQAISAEIAAAHEQIAERGRRITELLTPAVGVSEATPGR